MTEQLITLALLALPVACVAWTATHEEIFRELRDAVAERSRAAPGVVQRKFWYAWTCEYCLSHYIAAACVLLADFRLLAPGWRGTFFAWLALVAVANVYLSAYARLRVDVNRGRIDLQQAEAQHRRAG